MYDAHVIARLMREYREHDNLIIAVDFDNTVFDYHEQGLEFPLLFNTLHRCQNLDFYLFVFSASEEARYPFIFDYMEVRGINIKTVNESPIDWGYNKPFFNILLDDRAGLGSAVKSLRKVLSIIEEENNV